MNYADWKELNQAVEQTFVNAQDLKLIVAFLNQNGELEKFVKSFEQKSENSNVPESENVKEFKGPVKK